MSIPRDVHRSGQIERPTIWSFDARQWHEDSQLHFVIQERRIEREPVFWQTVRSDLQSAESGDLLLFVHGFNVGFDDAIYRTAQLAFDLKLRGIPVLYSWPSNAKLASYVADKDASLASVPSLKKFLTDLSEQSGARNIHVIAHSMGNYALVQALAQLQREQRASAPHFRQIVMAAPDLDRQIFEGLAAEFQRSTDRVTLYAASNDRALAASERLQGDPRIGDSSPMYLRKGIDSIDASTIIKGFLKHSYFADVQLMADITQLLQGRAPLPRFGLIGMPNEKEATHWAFR